MKCYYHRDMDGKCAAAIVYDKFHSELGSYLQMIDIDYKDDFDPNSISKDEVVWILDFSFHPEVMEQILKITQDITWIDHHKSAMEYKYSKELKGIRDINFAGCELTWKFLHPNDTMPRIVEMLGRYDIWDFSKYGDDLNRLQSGIRLYDTSPQSISWNIWLSTKYSGQDLDGIGYCMDELNVLLDEGSIALKYRNRTWASLIKAWGFFATFEGYKAICCNAGSVSSQMFDTITEDYDVMMPFIFDGKQWTISVYTKKDNIDCAELAKKYGGGGHKKAAGFQCKELPFKYDK